MYEVDLQGVYGIPEALSNAPNSLYIYGGHNPLQAKSIKSTRYIYIGIIKNQSAFTARERMIVCVSKVPDIIAKENITEVKKIDHALFAEIWIAWIAVVFLCCCIQSPPNSISIIHTAIHNTC